MYGKEELNLD